MKGGGKKGWQEEGEKKEQRTREGGKEGGLAYLEALPPPHIRPCVGVVVVGHDPPLGRVELPQVILNLGVGVPRVGGREGRRKAGRQGGR